LNISSATADGAAGQAANMVVRPEEPASCFLLNAQAQAPDTTAANVEEEASGRWFRQITPLGIRNARSPGTNLISKAPRLAHSLGALGPTPHAAPQLFQRAAEVALGVSFNAQSQAPDIPGASSRAAFLRHTASLQAQSKAPDIISLRAYSEQLLGSLNAQAQAPDDPSLILLDFHLLSLEK